MTLGEIWNAVLGLSEEAKDLSALQMAARAVIVYVVAIAIVRLGKKRFMSSATPFDIIVGIVIGSIVSRAITGNAPLAPALAGAAAIMAMHWIFSAIALRWHGFGVLIKGKPRLLIKDGKLDQHGMRVVHMTEHDVHEELREQGIDDLSKVGEARLERDGSLSVIKAGEDVKVIELGVEEGVRTVRLEIAKG